MWLDPPGTMRMVHENTRGWRAGSEPTQARAIPGSQHGDPHAWFVLLVLEDAYFRKLYGGEKLPPDAAIWVPLGMVYLDD